MKIDIEKLQEEEDQLWKELEHIWNNEEEPRKVARLIEINILLDRECNQ